MDKQTLDLINVGIKYKYYDYTKEYLNNCLKNGSINKMEYDNYINIISSQDN